MGGTTLSYTGKTVEDVLKQIKKGILGAIPTLFPDGDVALVKLSTKEGKIFKPTIQWSEEGMRPPKDVTFEEVEKGNVGMAITVASHYGAKPKKDEWVGCIHLHT